MDDLIKRLARWGEGASLSNHMLGVRSARQDCADAAAALSDAQATIARLEAALGKARLWIDEWPDPRYGSRDEADWRKDVLADIDAALSPREGE